MASKKKPEPVTIIRRSAYAGFEDVAKLTVDATYLGYTWPMDRVPVLARPGMVANCPNFDDGRIESITPDFCIVRFPNGDVWPFRWGEIALHNVEPDPAYLPPPQHGAISPEQLKAAVLAIVVKRWGPDALKKTPRLIVGATAANESGSGDMLDVDLDDLIAEATGQK